MMTVGVLFGGRSGEYDVSLCGAAAVYDNLDRSKYNVVAIAIDKDGRWYPDAEPEFIDDPDFGRIFKVKRNGDWYFNVYPDDGKLNFFDRHSERTLSVDIIFPVLHGTNCEDGRLQGLLELVTVPFVGSDVLGSAVGMDKDVAKRLLKEGGVNVVPWITVKKHEWENSKEFILQDILLEFGLPCFVKPANAGSSVGISKITTEEDFFPAVSAAFDYDNKVLIEKAINVREIELAVLGNEHPQCSVAGEILPHDEFYSYKAKYIDKNGAELMIPAEIDEILADEIRHCALNAYQLLCLKGMSRIDFFIDDEDNTYYVNEVNTLPGFTSVSMYPKLWEHSGLSYSELLDYLIDLALQNFAEKIRLKTEFSYSN